MSDWNPPDIRKRLQDAREEAPVSHSKSIRKVLHKGQLSKGSTPIDAELIEVQMLPPLRDPRLDGVHPVEESAVMGANVADDVQ